MKKKVIKIEKEKYFVQKNLEWATAHLYCKKKNCIARCKAKLYCKRRPLHCIVVGLRVFILQYTVLYCRKKKISVFQWALYCKMAAGGQSVSQNKIVL